MMLAPSLATVHPVINRWRVWLWAIEDLVAHRFGGKVATWVEHTPPNVVLARRNRRRWGHRRSWRRRHRDLARLSLIFDVQGLRRGDLSELAETTFRVRSSHDIIPKLFQ